MHRCDVMINTGDTFRSCDLAVMSRARCPCATPVTKAAFSVQLDGQLL